MDNAGHFTLDQAGPRRESGSQDQHALTPSPWDGPAPSNRAGWKRHVPKSGDNPLALEKQQPLSAASNSRLREELRLGRGSPRIARCFPRTLTEGKRRRSAGSGVSVGLVGIPTSCRRRTRRTAPLTCGR